MKSDSGNVVAALPRPYNLFVKVAAAIPIFLLSCISCSFGAPPKTPDQVAAIILRTRHLGAHGWGYNTASLLTLSNKLSADDIPAMLTLVAARNDVSVGAQFALASQCGPAIPAVRDAAQQRRMNFLDAQDTMSLIASFEKCSPDARNTAARTMETLKQSEQDEAAKLEQLNKQKNADDARIQANSLKLLNPSQAKSLTHEERLEIYHRSLAALGINESAPLSPDQQKLADRMYRSVVLQEVTTPPNQ